MRYTLQRMWLIVVVGAIVVGCASTIPLTPDAAKALTNREVTVARYEQPSFWPMSREKLALGLMQNEN